MCNSLACDLGLQSGGMLEDDWYIKMISNGIKIPFRPKQPESEPEPVVSRAEGVRDVSIYEFYIHTPWKMPFTVMLNIYLGVRDPD